MQSFKFIGAMVSEICVFKRRRRICRNHIYLYFVSCVIFSYNFLHAVTFLHVLHLDVLRSQIELKLKVKTENFLRYGYNAGPPMAIPVYTVLPYCVMKVFTLSSVLFFPPLGLLSESMHTLCQFWEYLLFNTIFFYFASSLKI